MSKSTNIEVVARVRPSFDPDAEYKDFCQNELAENGIRIEVKEGTKFGWLTNPKPHYEYNFTNLYWKESKQETIFQNVAMPIISHALEGFNATLFAYGQTGSGKTYTLSGGDTYDERGIIPRSISYIFQKTKQDPTNRYIVKLAYIEIYNNIAYDLLSSEEEQRDRSLDKLLKVQILDDAPNGQIRLLHDVKGKSEVERYVSDDETAFMLLFLGETNRAIAATQSNDVSSRSHCILTLTIENHDSEGNIKASKLNFVDLAGSERVENLSDDQNRIREARYINQSLFFLHNVIDALNTGSDFIPYRDSRMTLYLKDSLGGNCMTTMIATLSSKTSHMHETISTCNFAKAVMTVKNNAKMNVKVDPQVLIDKLRQEIVRLKQELAVARGEATEEPITPDECERLKVYVKDFMSGKIQMPSLSKSRIEYCWDYVRSHGFSDKSTENSDKQADSEENSALRQSSQSPLGTPQKQQMSDPELRKATAKLARKLQRRETEISVLVNMLNQSKCRLNAYVQTNIDEEGGDAAQEVIEEQPVNPKEKEEAFKKFFMNHPKYAAMRTNNKAAEEKVALAKETHVKAMALKKSVEEGKRQLTQRLSEIEGKDIESDPVIIEMRNRITAETNQYTGLLQSLKSIKTEIQTINGFSDQLKKAIQSDFMDFWMGHLKPAANRSRVNSSAQYQPPRTSKPLMQQASSQQEQNVQVQQQQQPQQMQQMQQMQQQQLQDPPLASSGRRVNIELTGDKRADEAILAFEAKKKEFILSAEKLRKSHSRGKDSQ